MTQILRHSQAIRGRLQQLFSESTRARRRVILTAYVGSAAPRLLPDYSDVEIYCWPQAGATDPNALAQLRDKHAQIFLCDGLHMKLYWVEGVGSIITSANLSDRALGQRTLHEFGVFLPAPDGIDIDSVIAGLGARSLTTSELRRLQRAHDLYWATNATNAVGKPKAGATYTEWYEGGREREWKLAWWDSLGEEAESSAQRGRTEFGVSSIEDYMDGNAGDFKEGDWLLCYKAADDKVGGPAWLFVQYVNPLTPDEAAANDGYTHQAIQATPLARFHQPPFVITPAFRRSFKAACGEYGIQKLMDGSLAPPKRFVDLLYRS